MLIEHVFEQQPLLLQQHHHRPVALLAEDAVQLFVRALDEPAALVHHLQEGKVVFPAHVRVVLAESGRDMDDARAVGEGDIAVAGDVKRLFLALVAVKERLVFCKFVFPALFHGQRFVFFEE